MRMPILRIATTVTCLVLCITPYQVQATAFLLDSNSSTYTAFDVPGAYFTQATGINDASQIVGYYFVPEIQAFHGFLYSGGSFTPVNFPGLNQTLPRGINNSGLIVGSYSVLPEPSSLLLLGLGLAGLAAWRWKRAAETFA